jgi:hypothetical protein
MRGPVDALQRKVRGVEQAARPEREGSAKAGV